MITSSLAPARLARYAAVACTVLWAAKAVAIGAAGGLDRSPLEGPLFLAGLLAAVVASASLGVARVGRTSTPARLLAGAAGVAGAITVSLAAGAIVSLVEPDHAGWVWGEVNLWALAVTVLALASPRPAPAVAADFR